MCTLEGGKILKKGKVLRRIAILLSTVALLASTVHTTYGYIVTSAGPLVNIFKPQDVQVSGLALEKKVEHPLGLDYKIPDNISFDFKIELGDYYANTKLETTAGQMTTDEKGNLTVAVKPGRVLGIEGLDEGTVVKVTEENTNHMGFAVKGDATQTVTAGADGNVEVSFTNIYTPASVTLENVIVKGTKVLEGRDWKKGDTFTFKLEQHAGDKWNELGKKTITYDANKKDYNTFEFTDIIKNLSFDKVGTYEFRISEIAGSLENVDYDRSVNRFTIKVTDVDMDGQLEINEVTGFGNSKVTKKDDIHTLVVTFNNKFVPPVIPDPTPINVPIRIEKTIENQGDVKLGTEGFEIVLENMTTGELLATTTKSDGSAMFELTFTKDDIDKEYRYKVYETHADKKGMTYDDTEYDVVITIRLNEDNKLVAAINGFATDGFLASFHNVYKMNQSTGPATGDVASISYGFVMMIVSAATLIALLITDREKKEEIKE